MEKKENKILKDVLIRLPEANYPARIYGLYDWDWDKEIWVINEEFYRKHIEP